MSRTTRILAGAMSGTSADGVDVALVRIDGRGLEMTAQLLHHHARPYPRELSQRIHRIRGEGHCRLDELAQLGREISIEYAEAVNAALDGANLKPADIAAIAAHGQTLFHSPPNTIQWFDPSWVAARTGCAVVSDFRRADLAAGGQGAPLVPFADYILFRHPEKSRVLLNIGGIANLTYLPAGGAIEDVIAFDTGPGNCISDHLCRKNDRSGSGFDEGGARAAKGRDRNRLAYHLVREHPYFQSPPPKSTDGPAMIAVFENAPLALKPFVGVEVASSEHGLSDLLAAAAALTAQSIQWAIFKFLPKLPDEVIVSGGGSRNHHLMDLLQFEFPVRVSTSQSVGVEAEAKEAVAFALLGAATLDNEPSNVPSVTGATRQVVLGSITPKP